ncbi:DUF333 domain-containing protein [Siccibacter turicensis]|uniref:putative hemolysin n=1 Tax=Siccibacter turicensis TaxID=357233 RepID=UPI0023F19B1C|nr:DUF333 domain-containing protein [Siccibacter turicensis]
MEQRRRRQRKGTMSVAAGILIGGVLLSTGHAWSASAPAQRANPAAVWCLEQGGVRLTVNTPAGSSTRCRLPDGTVEDEWVLFRRAKGAG